MSRKSEAASSSGVSYRSSSLGTLFDTPTIYPRAHTVPLHLRPLPTPYTSQALYCVPRYTGFCVVTRLCPPGYTAWLVG